MSETTEWEGIAYKQVFDEETLGLERRKAYDRDLSIQELENTLQSLYVSEGNNYTGRGPVGDIVMAATIAAYEQFIEEWKKDSRPQR
ncbi:hypothetical protein H0R92_03230 [Treponema sp. OMZ 840]|uniref:hypothetical protein n=1 Tax=Treponema sp. OMZ 840 TaxID=244313 RepID=UPI003D8AFFCE